MDEDVFPRRNLGKGEYWGRTIERDVRDLTKEAEGAGLVRKGNNRSNVAVAAELARNIERVEDLAEETAALIAATPATGSKGAYTDNFALTPGWQTVLVTAVPAVDGRPILDVFCTAVIRIVDPGTGGGSGGGAFSWPFPVETVTSEYGPRDGRLHMGIDFGISEGTPIPASNAGTVIGNGYGSGTGYYVDLSHDGGIVTRYFHMVVQSDIGPPGTVVSKGQTIGLVGNTGNSFGAHLHWETIVNGEHWNPRDFMSVYGDGSFAGGGGGGTGGGEFSNPRARIYLNGNPSYDFWPHRDVGGDATLNQLFPVQALSNFPSQAGQADAELQIFSQTNVPADPGNFARLTVETIFRPPA